MVDVGDGRRSPGTPMASLPTVGRALLLIALAGCGIGLGPDADPSAPLGSGARPQVTQAVGSAGKQIEAILESIGFSGAALVIRDEDELYRDALGLADTVTGERNTPRHAVQARIGA